VLLFGATFDNTGAHAMILTSIEEVARRAPGLAVVALSASEVRRRPDARYRMSFAPWSTGVKVRLLSPRLGRVAFPDVADDAVKAAREVLDSAQLALEISGFRLGSVWGLANSLDYLLNLLIMRVYRVRAVVMPQSLGPFEYRTWQRIALWPFMKLGLGWARAVYARERDGERWARRYVPETTHLHADMVLSHGPLDPALVYREGEGPLPAQVGRPAAAIVPSLRVIERVGDSLTDVYVRIVERLLASGRRVYLVTHSAEDAPASERIKTDFAADDRVQVIDRHLDPVEVEELMAELDLVVASRYHSVVHAYKQGVPAVVIGWAVKYAELAERFGQGRYVFDVRQGVPAEELLAALDVLLLEREAEAGRIRDGLSDLTVDDVFDTAFEG